MQTMWLETALSTYSLRLLANRKLEGEERNKIGGERVGGIKRLSGLFLVIASKLAMY